MNAMWVANDLGPCSEAKAHQTLGFLIFWKTTLQARDMIFLKYECPGALQVPTLTLFAKIYISILLLMSHLSLVPLKL